MKRFMLVYMLVPFLIGFIASAVTSAVISQPTEKPAAIDTNSSVFQIKYTQKVCHAMESEIGPTPNYSECYRMQEVTNTKWICSVENTACWLVDK